MGSQNRIGNMSEHSSTLNAFLSPKGSEFGYTYFKAICSPISLVIQKLESFNSDKGWPGYGQNTVIGRRKKKMDNILHFDTHTCP